jgi:patatin-like phospholipase/acyl hydrolase
MYRVQRRLKLTDEPKPCDYSHLIGGTSTGGLIALMLGRFGMTATQCLEEYNDLARKVFGKPKRAILCLPSEKGMFSASKLEKVVQDLAVRKANEENARILADEGSCRCFVTALAFSNVQKPTLLRSYRSDHEIPIDCTIWEAARATTAAPTFFKPIHIKR